MRRGCFHLRASIRNLQKPLQQLLLIVLCHYEMGALPEVAVLRYQRLLIQSLVVLQGLQLDVFDLSMILLLPWLVATHSFSSVKKMASG